MDKNQQRQNLDAIITYILIKKLITPFTKMPCYSTGIISSSGKVIKEPSTDDEKNSFTLLDRVVVMLRRLLGSKAIIFNRFLALSTQQNNFYNKLAVIGSIVQRAEIDILTKNLKLNLESKGINFEDYLQYLIEEEVQKKEVLNG